ncbi:GGDEF domain-containing protein [Nanoarchaeota archaeon]
MAKIEDIMEMYHSLLLDGDLTEKLSKNQLLHLNNLGKIIDEEFIKFNQRPYEFEESLPLHINNVIEDLLESSEYVKTEDQMVIGVGVKPVLNESKEFKSEYSKLIITKLELAKEKEESLKNSRIDKMTGLSNSSYGKDNIVNKVSLWLRYGGDFSVIMADLDNFKHFNDTYKHQKGDVALAEVGALINFNVRDTDTKSRYGGEEFLIGLDESDHENSFYKADDIRQKIFEKSKGWFFKLPGYENLSVSIGLANIDDVYEIQLLKDGCYGDDDRYTGYDLVCDYFKNIVDGNMGEISYKIIKKYLKENPNQNGNIEFIKSRLEIIKDAVDLCKVKDEDGKKVTWLDFAPENLLNEIKDSNYYEIINNKKFVNYLAANLIIRKADLSLYDAKENGRNRVEVYTPDYNFNA